MIDHHGPISGVAAYQDKYIATAGYDNKVILWSAQSHESLACGFHDHLANQCQFSPDGQYLVSSSSDYSARLWSVPDMKLISVLNDHSDDVEGVAFHPHKKLIATVCRDHYVRIFAYDGKLIKKLKGHSQDVISVTWLNDDELITSSDDGTVKQWNVALGKLSQEIDLNGVETDTVAISKNGIIFAGNDLGEIVCINNNKRETISAHKAGIKRLCYSEAQNILVSLSYDRTANLWHVNKDGTLQLFHTTALPSQVWARSCAFSGRNNLIFVTFGNTYAIYNYNKKQWDLTRVKTTPGKNAVLAKNEDIYSIGDDGQIYKNDHCLNQLPSLCNFLIAFADTILTGGQTGVIFDALTGEKLYQHRSPLNCAALFHRDAKPYVIIGTYTGEGLVFGLVKKQIKLIEIIKLHENAIKGITASNKYIYSVCATSAAAFHDIESFTLKKFLPRAHNKIANGCTYIADNCFASISRDLTLRLTSLKNQIIIKTPHDHSIKCIAVSQDKRFIATGGYFGSIHIYDLKTKKWQSYRPTHTGISSLTYQPTKHAFVASSYDNRLYTCQI